MFASSSTSSAGKAASVGATTTPWVGAAVSSAGEVAAVGVTTPWVGATAFALAAAGASIAETVCSAAALLAFPLGWFAIGADWLALVPPADCPRSTPAGEAVSGESISGERSSGAVCRFTPLRGGGGGRRLDGFDPPSARALTTGRDGISLGQCKPNRRRRAKSK